MQVDELFTAKKLGLSANLMRERCLHSKNVLANLYMDSLMQAVMAFYTIKTNVHILSCDFYTFPSSNNYYVQNLTK